MAASISSSPEHEQELLSAFRGGDQDAFEKLVRPYRPELHAHCYRMLGSLHDAEDALQDAMLRAWRGLSKFEGRSSVRSWLYTIATNTCLNAIARRPKRVLPIDHRPPADPQDGPGEPLTESVWVEPYPDEQIGVPDGAASPEARYELRESVELAFVAALQNLPATQRAVLIMREVLGFSAQEVAGSLQTTVPSVNSALQRARKTTSELLPERSQQATLRSLGDRRLRALVERYMSAMQHADVDTVVGMLAEEAAWSMPPLASWFSGPGLPEFLRRGPLSGEFRWRHLPAHANGQAAVGCYTWHPDAGAYLPFALDVLTLDGGQIKQVTAFIVRSSQDDPELFARWPDAPPDPDRVASVFGRIGLPDRLD
ncbi:MAG: sigma-70 family RNA polymerase sigma factor [Actinomycetota bacterium]|nr:sigma-70 family RNA polymerase sigma factor [Actinomycetota bacterium]